jgi:hypothetical protein
VRFVNASASTATGTWDDTPRSKFQCGPCLSSCPGTARAELRSRARRLLFSAPSAALALPTDEPSDHEHGPHENDDHAYADEQIGENDSGAALDAHRPSVGRMASPVHPLRCFHMGAVCTGLALTPGFYSPMVRVRPRLSGFIEPCLPSPAPNPPAGDGW